MKTSVLVCTLVVGMAGDHQAAAAVDFAVTVVDDRPEFSRAEDFPRAQRVLCHPFEGAVEAARHSGEHA